ncbi:MAG TPA: hypothetical protein VGK20_06730 [Candidatus Binatia bacterium]|jgi:hypothetical protein
MTRRRRVAVGAALAAALGIGAAACSRPLPEEGSADAQLYAAQCGSCHAPYQPHSMTSTMWKLQVDRMDQKFREVGRVPPSGPERQRILRYLSRNAGG